MNPFAFPRSMTAIASRLGRPPITIDIKPTAKSLYAAKQRGTHGPSAVADTPEEAVEQCLPDGHTVKKVLIRYPFDYEVTVTDANVVIRYERKPLPLHDEDLYAMLKMPWLAVAVHAGEIIGNHDEGDGEAISVWLDNRGDEEVTR